MIRLERWRAARNATVILEIAVLGGMMWRPSEATGQTLAQPIDTEARVTRGLFIPDGARSGEVNATAVELNPAQLPFLRASATSLIVDASRREVALPGRGLGLFWAAPLWSGGGLGLGLQEILGESGGLTSERTKFQLAFAQGGRHFSLGANWAHLWGDTVGGLDTFDVGAALRLADRVGLGFVIEDVFKPSLTYAPAPGAVPVAVSVSRRWAAELTLRPLGTDRLNLAVAALHAGDDVWSDGAWGSLGWRLRAAARVTTGWHVFADVDWGPRSRASALQPGDFVREPRLTVGLTLDFDRSALDVAVRHARAPAGLDGAGWGTSVAWHDTGEQNPHAIEPAQVVRVALHDLEGDRQFVEFVLALRAMAFDNGVAGVWLEIEDLDVGLGRIEELRDAIAELRRHDKRVVASLSSASLRELYLAAACNRIVIHPAGTLTFAGFAQSVTFYKGAMDRLGVSVDLVRIAEFKGAMEPYILNQQSEAVRRNRNELLDDVFGRVTQQIALGRGWAEQALRRDPGYIDGLLAKAAFTPHEARQAGMVDAVLDKYDQEAYLRDWFGREVSIRDHDATPLRPERWARARVALILVDGAINDGASRQLPIGMGIVAGDDSLVDALDRCRRDSSVRAVVLRVNSPGGSAYASDVIARAVAKLRASGKPVIASMGDVAASGGYYVAAPTDAIFAEPSTTTGSIGIFGFKVDASRLLSMLSLNTETYRRGAHADQQSPYRPWTDEERAVAEQKIRYLYQLFLKTVADGRRSRGLTPERVNEVGRGHVWTGSQARSIGLVDAFGGVSAAIERAAELAGIGRLEGELPELLMLPRPSSGLVQRLIGLSQTLDGAGDESGATAIGATSLQVRSPELRAALRSIAPYLLGPSEGFDARLPYDWDLH
jgi:protease-4